MDTIYILDFGGQYTQLIARRVREAKVYCEIVPYGAALSKLDGDNVRGYILAGGPASVYADNAYRCDPGIYALGKPVLGICYGAQLIAVQLGGEVHASESGEYGHADITMDADCPLFDGIDTAQSCWMSHNDRIGVAPAGFTPVAKTAHCPIAAMYDAGRSLYAIQFHPEVRHTAFGPKLLQNFLYGICGCKQEWIVEGMADMMIADIREKVGDGKLLSALSGGVDSAVASALAHKAVGDRLTCVFVDHGLLRQGEAEEVVRVFRDQFGMNLIAVDARERFMDKLKGVTDPEKKRAIIGNEFIRVFEEEARKLGKVDYLVQGTIYPDVIESGVGNAQVIKSHHNVGGLPDVIDFKGVIEPLRQLFKDEVRALGTSLGIPDAQVWRQPFPGPGLAIRVIGDVTEEKLEIVRHSDAILREEVKLAGMERDIWQYFTVYTGVRSVGVMGDGRTYDTAVAVRAVTSSDAMTVGVAELPYWLLLKLSSRIINEVPGVNRVTYDITTKPPGTIEWE